MWPLGCVSKSGGDPKVVSFESKVIIMDDDDRPLTDTKPNRVRDLELTWQVCIRRSPLYEIPAHLAGTYLESTVYPT